MHKLGGTYTLRGGAILVGDELDFLPVGDVEVHDGIISRIAPELANPALPLIDSSGKLLVPGFINGHTHFLDAAIKDIAYNAEPGTNLFFPPDGVRPRALSQLTEEHIVDAMRRTARFMVSSGTVAFADFTSGGLSGVEQIKSACQESALLCLSLGNLAGSPIQSDHILDDNREGLSREQLAELEELVSLADGLAPVRASDLTDHAMQDFHKVASEAGKLVATHAAALPSYRETSVARTGRSDVERVVEHLKPDFLVHLTHANAVDLRSVANAGTAIIMCARANVTLLAGAPPYLEAITAGATVGFGTDNVMLENPDLMSELGFMGRLVRGPGNAPPRSTPFDLLRSATIDGARALKIDEKLGSLKAGKAASMVLIDLQSDSLAFSSNPVASLVHRATRADISAVIIEGALVSGALV